MANLNSFHGIGRIGQLSDLRHTPNGKAVIDISLAIAGRGKGDDQKTTWVDVTAWQANAEFVAKYLKVGSKIRVSGRLEQDKYEVDGQKRSKHYIVADDVEPLDPPKKAEADNSAE